MKPDSATRSMRSRRARIARAAADEGRGAVPHALLRVNSRAHAAAPGELDRQFPHRRSVMQGMAIGHGHGVTGRKSDLEYPGAPTGTGRNRYPYHAVGNKVARRHRGQVRRQLSKTNPLDRHLPPQRVLDGIGQQPRRTLVVTASRQASHDIVHETALNGAGVAGASRRRGGGDLGHDCFWRDDISIHMPTLCPTCVRGRCEYGATSSHPSRVVRSHRPRAEARASSWFPGTTQGVPGTGHRLHDQSWPLRSTPPWRETQSVRLL